MMYLNSKYGDIAVVERKTIMRTHSFKAVRKDVRRWQTGSLVVQNKTTYCFKEDYERNPSNTVYYIAFDGMTDWGLPNRHLITEVFPDTICEAVDGLFTTVGSKRQLFEGDIVNIKTGTNSFKNYVLKWSEKTLGWIAVSENKNGFDVILDKDWQYEFVGNIHDPDKKNEGEEK